MLLTPLVRVSLILTLCRVGCSAPTDVTENWALEARDRDGTKIFDLERRVIGANDPTDVDGYGTAFWLSEKRGWFPRDGRCLFYTSPKGSGSLSETARAYSATNNLDSIWKQFSCRFYKEDNDRRAAIYAQKRYRSRYFKQMSTAYASYCTGIATLMVRNVNTINEDGIWWASEYPTLTRAGTPITEIQVIDTNGANRTPIWRNGAAIPPYRPPGGPSYMPPKRKARALGDEYSVTDAATNTTSIADEDLTERDELAELFTRADPTDPTGPTDDDCEDGDDPCPDKDCPEDADCFPNGVPDWILAFNSDPDPDTIDW